jgi:hypothetical protein
MDAENVFFLSICVFFPYRKITVVKLSCDDVFGPGDFVLPVLVINFKSVNKPYFKNLALKETLTGKSFSI